MAEARLELFYHGSGNKEEKHHEEESQVESVNVLLVFHLFIQRCQPGVSHH